MADAGYGSFSNYIYCEQHGMKKFMKFPMFKKQTSDAKYRDNPFRAENFTIDANGIMRCPFGRAFKFQYKKRFRETITDARKRFTSVKTAADALMPRNVKGHQETGQFRLIRN